MTPPVGIKYVSLFETSGYAIAARRYILGIAALGIPITWVPLRWSSGRSWGYKAVSGKSVGDPELDPFCNRDIPYDTVIIHTVPEYFPEWAEKERGKKIYGSTVWETDKSPQHWPEILNKLDGVLVPCKWNKEVFQASGIHVPIATIPHIITEQKKDIPPLYKDIPQEDFVFYTINNWTVRKSIWNTVKAYLNAFDGDDPVQLVIKTSIEDYSRPYGFLFRRLLRRDGKSTKGTLQKILRGYKNPAKIRCIYGEISDDGIHALHQRGDCYVSLCRSEGWGLGAFDACAYGNPVVTTNYGGHLEYLPKHHAYLVDYDLIGVEDRVGRRSYAAEQKWAEPNLVHASTLLRHIYENQAEAKLRGNQLKQFVEEKFNYKAVTDVLLDFIGGNCCE